MRWPIELPCRLRKSWKASAQWPELVRKLFLSPYGVDLDAFPTRTGTLPSDPTLLFVGNWSYRKGVDVLVEAIEAMDGVRLIHVGALLDAPFPKDLRFRSPRTCSPMGTQEISMKRPTFLC